VTLLEHRKDADSGRHEWVDIGRGTFALRERLVKGFAREFEATETGIQLIAKNWGIWWTPAFLVGPRKGVREGVRNNRNRWIFFAKKLG
jgi:hypothetical protein